MSEKIFLLLLRLYPARFRERYGAEARLLLQERLRDEHGALPRLRLWMDLLVDLLSGLPLALQNGHGAVVTAEGLQSVPGQPAFRSLEHEPLRPSSVAMGGIFAVAALALFVFVMSHTGALHPFPGSIERLRGATSGSQSNPDVQQVAEKLERQMQSANQLERCSFEKLEQHPGNIGYVKLSWFADPAQCGAVAQAVMEHLNETDAVIFDLRDARGGFPESVRGMAGWLFDRPTAWYNPRATSQGQLVTDSPVAGSRLANVPVFVLTSSQTFSGAEHFAYNLKMLKRATIVGETTSGKSHGAVSAGGAGSGGAGAEAIPAWEGKGVQPDVRVRAADALKTAEKLAREAIGK